jgi:hypothetical protein
MTERRRRLMSLSGVWRGGARWFGSSRSPFREEVVEWERTGRRSTRLFHTTTLALALTSK